MGIKVTESALEVQRKERCVLMGWRRQWKEIPEGLGRILTGGDDGDRTECSKYIRWRGGEVQAKEAVTEIEYM